MFNGRCVTSRALRVLAPPSLLVLLAAPRWSFNSLPSTYPLQHHNKAPNLAIGKCAHNRSDHK
jgi:hypothetical protein